MTMQLNILHILFVGLGGALGSVVRYLCYLLEKSYFKTLPALPVATLSINLIGCFVIGCFLSKTLSPNFQPSNWTSFMMIGTLGGFTTFSSFTAENVVLIIEGKILLALSYITLSVTLGILMTYCGFIITKT